MPATQKICALYHPGSCQGHRQGRDNRQESVEPASPAGSDLEAVPGRRTPQQNLCEDTDRKLPYQADRKQPHRTDRKVSYRQGIF